MYSCWLRVVVEPAFEGYLVTFVFLMVRVVVEPAFEGYLFTFVFLMVRIVIEPAFEEIFCYLCILDG